MSDRTHTLYGIDGDVLRTGLTSSEKESLERMLDGRLTCTAHIIIDYHLIRKHPDLLPERRKREARRGTPNDLFPRR
jgi:hypothetical protein